MEFEQVPGRPDLESESSVFWDIISYGGILILVGILAVVLLKCAGSTSDCPTNSIVAKLRLLCTNVTLTVGMIAIAAMTAFMEQYLRISQHFIAVSREDSSQDEADENGKSRKNRQSRICYQTILKYLCSFGQRVLTFRAAYLIVTNSDWSISVSTLVLSTILIPRILFSLFVIRHQRDLSRRQPRDPNLEVNLSLRLLHYVYKGSRRFYNVLSGIENEIFFLKNQIQYVAMQLLGHSYRVQSIQVFGDLESIVFIGWSIFTYGELRTDIVYLFSLILIVFLRVGFIVRVKI